MTELHKIQQYLVNMTGLHIFSWNIMI